ncbi:hypothetical protein KOR42_13860 [Thalassoglobus neptunius]|uniref:FHA domain-containing protein n=1 Tax=Thalassoglobus neptunius TaxID=1938619 RepID=A0A5C5X4H1_9PLAN|nr:hypothetical protein [Thalassoglobus neptunius]TWT58017.1 hypothetical protein KOR42_13860 [Thalassoglobus neptunius]
MRLRLYEVGGKSTGRVMRFDQFPALLCVDTAGDPCTHHESFHSVCEMVDIGGQIEVRAASEFEEILVNNVSVTSGALMPGDRLSLGKTSFIVSYERTARERPPSMQVKILN